MIETRSWIIVDVVELPPQNVKMPIFLSDDTSTLAAQYLEETLQNPTSNSPFATINETYH